MRENERERFFSAYLLNLRGLRNNQLVLSTRSNTIFERECDVAGFYWLNEGNCMVKRVLIYESGSLSQAKW